jgi:DNA-binding response OmpR family regulator
MIEGAQEAKTEILDNTDLNVSMNQPTPEPDPMEETTIRILLVEDSEDLARLVRRTLPAAANVGIDVSWVARLDAAIEQVGNSRFDAILLDLSLPDSSGVETVIRMRQHCPDIPIIVLTAEEDEQTALRAVGAGAQDYIGKTEWRPDTLARAIRYAMERQKTALGTAASKASKAVALIGARGGVGTTSVALNIAAALARSGHQTIAVELNHVGGAFQVHLALNPSSDVSELAALPPPAITRAALYATLLEIAPNLKILCSPRRSADFAPIGAQEAEAIVSAAMQVAEFVIVDLPPFPSAAAKAAVRKAFFTVLVTERDPHCLAMAKDTVAMLEGWGIGGNGLGAVVVNRSAMADAAPLQQVSALLGCKLFGVVPPAPTGSAYFQNLPITLSKPETTAAQSLSDIGARLTDFVVRFADV